MKKVIFSMIGLLVLTSLAFSFSFGTGNIQNPKTAPVGFGVHTTNELDPAPSPTPDLEVEPAATPEPMFVIQNSTGDWTNPGNALDFELATNRTYEPLPFKDEPYTHPSGAFTFGMPEGWNVLTEDEGSATITDGDSAVGATFTEVGKVYSDKEMDEFANSFVTIFFSYITEDYKILERKVLADGSTFVAVEYKQSKQKNDADFIFKQHDTVVFTLLLTSPVYEKISPTWNKIIESYTVDAEAAKAASQAAATPAPEATAEPTATPAPDNSDYAPQPGRSRLFVGNDYSETLTFTINNTENKVSVGGQVPIDLNPGKYTFTVSIPGGAVNGEVEVGPDQSWGVYVDEHGSVYGPFQVYP